MFLTYSRRTLSAPDSSPRSAIPSRPVRCLRSSSVGDRRGCSECPLCPLTSSRPQPPQPPPEKAYKAHTTTDTDFMRTRNVGAGHGGRKDPRINSLCLLQGLEEGCEHVSCSCTECSQPLAPRRTNVSGQNRTVHPMFCYRWKPSRYRKCPWQHRQPMLLPRHD